MTFPTDQIGVPARRRCDFRSDLKIRDRVPPVQFTAEETGGSFNTSLHSSLLVGLIPRQTQSAIVERPQSPTLSQTHWLRLGAMRCFETTSGWDQQSESFRRKMWVKTPDFIILKVLTSDDGRPRLGGNPQMRRTPPRPAGGSSDKRRQQYECQSVSTLPPGPLPPGPLDKEAR